MSFSKVVATTVVLNPDIVFVGGLSWSRVCLRMYDRFTVKTSMYGRFTVKTSMYERFTVKTSMYSRFIVKMSMYDRFIVQNIMKHITGNI